LLAVLLLIQAVEGWRRWRTGEVDRRLAEHDWVIVLLGLATLSGLLALGPVVARGAFGARPIDEGLYAWLWPHVFLFRAIRGPTRIGILILFAGGLLAALGVKWLLAAPRRAWGIALVGVLGLALILEYAWMPLPYRPESAARRPVDKVLAADPSDVAVLEWPLHVRGVDLDAMFRSLGHGKRVVNGLSGFVPSAIRDLSILLSVQGNPLSAEAQTALRRIYPLRYLVVHLADHRLASAWQGTWHRFRRIHPPMLRHRGTYGDADLYEILPVPERGRVLERWISYDFLVAHPVLEATVRALGHEPGRADWVEVTLNDRLLTRVPLDRPQEIRLRLHPPFRRAAPNTIRLTYSYERLAGPEIGTTGVRSPVDLAVVSGGQPHGDVASIRVNDVEHARSYRGYNLVAIDPSGRVVRAEVFDTFLDPGASGRLARWLDRLPPGSVVAGSIKDEASSNLDEPAVRALRTVGVREDLRGRYRESHGFVGVKGAPPGSALEGAGRRRVTLTVEPTQPGASPTRARGVELTGFALVAAARSEDSAGAAATVSDAGASDGAGEPSRTRPRR
jgi:hypothetical protein